MTTINNINYEILAEVKNTDLMIQMNPEYVSMVTLKRPAGRIEFNGMRKANGSIELV